MVFEQLLLTPDINKLVDERSRNIWNEISKQYNISFVFYNEPNYRCYIKSKEAIIYVSQNNYNKDYFAHEMLHIYLDSKNINIGGYIIARFKENNLLSLVFTNLLIEHISNTLDHIKILPLYLDLGFERSQFIHDYTTPKCTDEEINRISTCFSFNTNLDVWKYAVDLFLGKFFAIRSCPNNTIDYSNFLDKLKQIDEKLFTILEVFWNSWITYEIEKYDMRDYNYWNFCDIFYDSLTNWILNSSFFSINE